MTEITAAELLADLRRQGLDVRADGDALWVTPRERIPAELRALIPGHKPGLLALLAAEVRCHCGRPLNEKLQCWKCCDRLCGRCRKTWTASAFIVLCNACALQEQRPPAPPDQVERKRKCHYCDGPEEFLCDFVLDPQTRRTCDRPLCRAHRVQRGHMHICTRGGKHKGCRVETIDYCPAHAATADATGGGQPPANAVGGGRPA